jgi:hypothetical protein
MTTNRVIIVPLGERSPEGTAPLQATFNLEFTSYTIAENSQQAFKILRTVRQDQELSVDWACVGVTAATPVSGTATFAPSQTEATVVVSTGEVSADEQGTFELSNPQYISGPDSIPVLGADSSALFFINDVPEPPDTGQDVIWLHDHNTEPLGSPSGAISGLFTISTDEYSTPDQYLDYAIDNSNPLYPGEKYWRTNLVAHYPPGQPQDSPGVSWRTERSSSIENFQRTSMVNVGGDQYIAPEKIWYGIVFRMDRMDKWGRDPLPSPKGGGIIVQWHMRNFWGNPDIIPPYDLNPHLSLVHHIGGIYLRLEANEDNGGSDLFLGPVLDESIAGTAGNNYLDGETHAFIFEILWDTRTQAQGSQGILRLYVDDNPVPAVEWLNKQNVHPMPWLDQQLPPRMPYWKYGGYRRDFETFTSSLPEGTAQQFSWGHFALHGENASRQGVLDSLDWNNRADQVLWIGDNRTGDELGCLAVNDNWATTVYEYTPIYAPTVPTIPTPTDDPASTGSSRVNPNAPNEYLVETAAGWTTALTGMNAGTYNKIFVKKGVNASGESLFTLTQDGTSGSPNWIVYWDPDDNTVVNTDWRPWNAAFATRATVSNLRVEGNYTYIMGLAWGSVSQDISNSLGWFSFQGGMNNGLMYRCVLTHCGGPWNISVRQNSSDCDIYQCVARSTNLPIPTVNDCEAVIIIGAQRVRVVSCEFYDTQGNGVEWNTGNNQDLIIEDCDIYTTPSFRYDGDGNQQDDGNYSIGESPVGGKHMQGTPGNKCVVRGNRFWGQRQIDPKATGSTTANDQILFNTSHSGAQTEIRERVEITKNVAHDFTGTYGVIVMSHNQIPGPERNFEVTENLVADHVPANGYPGHAIRVSFNETAVYSNTWARCAGTASFFGLDGPVVDNLDFLGNVFTDCPSDWANTSYLLSSCIVGYHGILGSTNNYEKNASSTSYINIDVPSMFFGDFRYRRKKMTAPEIGVIADVVPTNNTPNEFLIGARNAGIGTRPGVGI